MAALLGVGAAAGCVSVLPEAGPAPEIYRLNDGTAELARSSVGDAAAPSADWALSVPEPIAPSALATDRIAVVTGGAGISYAAGARWSESAPRMLQERVLTAFEDDAGVRAAVRPEDGVATRFELRLELLRFEAVYPAGGAGAPTAQVSVRAKLVDRDDRVLAASRRLEANRRADANALGDIIAAFDAASSEVSRELARWTAVSGEDYLADSADGGTDGGAAQPSASAASSSR